MKRLVFFMLTITTFQIGADPQNMLKKAFFHRGAHASVHTKKHVHIELGNIVFYFERKPRIESSVVKKNHETMHRLFLPNVTVSNDLLAKLQGIHTQTEGFPFRVTFFSKENPKEKGLEITLTYATNKVGVKLDHFDSIGLQKGLTLQLYDKELIQRIKQMGKQIITTALHTAPRVFIDCGHGGADCGAISNLISEKEVSLAVGLGVAEKLREQGVLVDLSRDKDMFIPLDARTTLANEKGADIFVSIHANSAGNERAKGIETFFLHDALLQRGDIGFCSAFEQRDAAQAFTEKCKKSNRLAQCVHKSLINRAQTMHAITDRKVKPAISQVLLGAHMPSTLVEIGFITHPQEAQLLSEKPYQELLAHGIAHGILSYLNRA